MNRRTNANRVEASLVGERLLRKLKFLEKVQIFPSGPALRAVVSESIRLGNLRGLKLIARDVDEMMSTLSPDQLNELADILQSDLGVKSEEQQVVDEK